MAMRTAVSRNWITHVLCNGSAVTLRVASCSLRVELTARKKMTLLERYCLCRLALGRKLLPRGTIKQTRANSYSFIFSGADPHSLFPVLLVSLNPLTRDVTQQYFLRFPPFSHEGSEMDTSLPLLQPYNLAFLRLH